MPTRNPTILAIDPGLRELGYAVLSGRRLLARDAVSLKALPSARHLSEARRRIAALVETHRPGTIVVEKTYRHPLPWLHRVHRLTLFARRLARRSRAHFVTYAPQAVRATVVGNGRAKKSEAALAVAARFPSLRVYLTQDRRWKERFFLNMFDAVALAIHHQTRTQPPSRSR